MNEHLVRLWGIEEESKAKVLQKKNYIALKYWVCCCVSWAGTPEDFQVYFKKHGRPMFFSLIIFWTHIMDKTTQHTMAISHVSCMVRCDFKRKVNMEDSQLFRFWFAAKHKEKETKYLHYWSCPPIFHWSWVLWCFGCCTFRATFRSSAAVIATLPLLYCEGPLETPKCPGVPSSFLPCM